jgi:hypothetical protein
MATNHLSPRPIGIDSIDVGALRLETIGHLVEEFGDLLVADAWWWRFHCRI